MATKRRLILENVPYHITTKIVNNEMWFGIPEQLREKKAKGGRMIYTRIFSGINRREIISIFAKIIKHLFIKYKFIINHFVLMGNHYHMVAKATDPKFPLNLCMQTFNMMVAKKLNELLNRTGAFFGSRYHSQAILDEQYGTTVLGYIYANPVKAGICIEASDHDCTSYNCYVEGKSYIIEINQDCDILNGIVIKKEQIGEALKNIVEGYIYDKLEIKHSQLKQKMKGQILANIDKIKNILNDFKIDLMQFL